LKCFFYLLQKVLLPTKHTFNDTQHEYEMFRNANNNNNVRKPYCKVCHDAGKPESEYTSHYVKSLPDRTGKTNIICPTLLSTNCRFCKKAGHTTKFCPTLADMKKDEDKKNRGIQKQKQEMAKVQKQEKKPRNVFNVLQMDSDSEEDMQEQEPVQKPMMTGYAAALMKPKPSCHEEKITALEKAIQTGFVSVRRHAVVSAPLKSEDECQVAEVVKAIQSGNVVVREKLLAMTTSKWALIESDDEEEEEEEEQEDNSAW